MQHLYSCSADINGHEDPHSDPDRHTWLTYQYSYRSDLYRSAADVDPSSIYFDRSRLLNLNQAGLHRHCDGATYLVSNSA